MKKIYIGADHAGFKLKEKIKKYFDKKNIAYADLGNLVYDKTDDYPDFAFRVAENIVRDKTYGILLCGSAQGMVIAANKVKGARAVAINNIRDAKSSKFDDDSNILCLAGRTLNSIKAKKILKIWLDTPFSKLTRHKRRVKKITKYES